MPQNVFGVLTLYIKKVTESVGSLAKCILYYTQLYCIGIIGVYVYSKYKMKNKSFNHNILKYNMRVIKNIIKKKLN